MRFFEVKFVRYLLLLLLCFILYGNTINNSYSLDDELVTDTNPTVKRGIKAFYEIFTTPYYKDRKYQYDYRPVVKMTFAIEYSLFNANPAVSHFVNILLYFFCCLLLMNLLEAFFMFNGSVAPVFFSVLLFVVHPLHSEVVCSLKNRDVLLSFIGSLSAFIFFKRYALKNTIADLLLGSVATLFALLSKLDSMIYFGIIPVLLYYHFQARRISILKILLAMFCALVAFYLLILPFFDNQFFRSNEFFENQLFSDPSFANRIVMMFYTIFFYVKTSLIPYPLICYYGYAHETIPFWGNVKVLAGLVIVVCSFFLFIWSFRRNKMMFSGLLFFYSSVFIVGNFISPVVGVFGERFVFSSVVGFSLLAVSFVEIISVKLNSLKVISKKGLFACFAGVIIFYSYITFARTFDWKDYYTLFKTDIEKAPNSVKLNNLYADKCLDRFHRSDLSNLERKSLLDESVAHYRHSLSIYPSQAATLNNLGLIYGGIYNMPDSALIYFRLAANIDNKLPEYNFNTGYTYSILNLNDSAIAYYNKALMVDSAYILAYNAITQSCISTNLFDYGINTNLKAWNNGIKDPDIAINLGNLFLSKHDTAQALIYFDKAIKQGPVNDRIIELVRVLSMDSKQNN